MMMMMTHNNRTRERQKMEHTILVSRRLFFRDRCEEQRRMCSGEDHFHLLARETAMPFVSIKENSTHDADIVE